MANIRWKLTVAAAIGLAAPPVVAGQVLASRETNARPDRCDLVEITNRLRVFHPLGAAAAAAGQCLSDAVQWVPTTPMETGHRLAWRRALGALERSGDPSCHLAARTLVWLEQVGVVSVWAPADTAAGLVYFGSSYATEGSAPLAVQFWAPAFERPNDWLAGALAHEAFHVLHAESSEAEATAFGQSCGRQTAFRP